MSVCLVLKIIFRHYIIDSVFSVSRKEAEEVRTIGHYAFEIQQIQRRVPS